jgi:hypothetical protein
MSVVEFRKGATPAYRKALLRNPPRDLADRWAPRAALHHH